MQPIGKKHLIDLFYFHQHCSATSLTSVMHTQRAFQLVPKSTSKPFSFFEEEQATAITALQEVPKTLWAVSKYDVGLIKDGKHLS